MSIESSQGPSTSVPIGLLLIQDLVTRIPLRKQELLVHEVARREAECISLRETRRALSWHPMRAVKRVLFYGLNAFGVAWALGSVASLMEYYASLNSLVSKLSLTGFTNGVLGTPHVVPSTTTFSLLNNLPSPTLTDSIYIGLAVAVLVALEHGIVAAIYGKKARALHEAEKTLEIEIAVLRTWVK